MAVYQLFLEILKFHNLNEFYFSILATLNKFIEVFYQILNPFIILDFKRNTILFFQTNYTSHDIIHFQTMYFNIFTDFNEFIQIDFVKKTRRIYIV